MRVSLSRLVLSFFCSFVNCVCGALCCVILSCVVLSCVVFSVVFNVVVLLCCCFVVLLLSLFVRECTSMEKGGIRGLLCGFVCQGEWVVGKIRSIRIQFPGDFFGFVSK